MARPEVLGAAPPGRECCALEPLSDDEADELIRDAVPATLRDRIAHAAGGNPLFISEMLEVARDRADVEVPPTLKALLATRLDQLNESERHVLGRGSVEGELFHRGAVQVLAPEEPQVTARLMALVRRRLIRPDRAEFEGEDGWFRHLLIRDLQKPCKGCGPSCTLRRLAGGARWAGRTGRDRRHHLEQASLSPRARARRTSRLHGQETGSPSPAAARSGGKTVARRRFSSEPWPSRGPSARRTARGRPGGDLLRRRRS
jgi:hypothetical protein